MPARNPIPLEGVLNCWNDPYDLPDLLLSVSRSGKTGRLSFSNPEADKTIYVKDGKIVFAESSSDDDGLGQYLLRNGQISLDDFTRVSKLVSPGKRLGALLVAEGVLEPKDLVPAVVGQVRAVILGLFRRTETWYGFKEEDLSRKESITLDMPVAQLVLDGVQLVDSWRRISKGVGDLESVYQVAGATEVEWSRLKLESGPSELLTLLSSPLRIADVCAETSIDDFDACRYLWAFKSLEWIELAEIPREEAPEIAEETEVSAAAEMADMAEMASPFPMTAAATPTAPAQRVPDPATTVMNLEPAVPIPQRLVETKISAVKEPATPRPQQPAPPPPPRPVPANLHHTQLAVDLPGTPPPGPATTQPAVSAPKPIPEALQHTQLYLDAPAAEPEPARATTGEMMEAILDGSGDAPGTAYEPESADSSPVPEPRSDSATQFFPAASALPPQTPAKAPEPPEEDFFSSAPGFASLSLDYTAGPPPELPPPSGPQNEPSFSSFSELAPPHAEEGMPLIEATVIEATVVDSVEPLSPAQVITQPSASPVPAGLEFFAMNDPFRTADTSKTAAPPPTAFATDDPFQYAETSVAASLPTRPRTEELDLDLGHFFNGDENK